MTNTSNPFATIGANRDGSPRQALSPSCAKSDDKPWTHGFDFLGQPSPADLDFAGVGTLTQPRGSNLKCFTALVT